MCGRSWPPRVPAPPGLTVSMWLSSQLSILRKSFLLMRRGFRQQQRLEYLSKLFTSTWMAHSSSVQSAMATRGHLQGPGLGGGCQGWGSPGHPRASQCHQGARRERNPWDSTKPGAQFPASPQKGSTCPACPPGAAAPARGMGRQLWRQGPAAPGPRHPVPRAH